MTRLSPPPDLYQMLQMAMQHHEAGQFAKAEALYRQILAADPKNLDALHLLGLIACEAKQYTASEELIRQAIALQPQIPHLHFNLAETLHRAGKLPDAVAELRHAINLKPDFLEAHSNLGAVLRELGQHDEALRALRRAVELGPGSAQGRLNLALALLADNAAEGVAELEKVEAQNPSEGILWHHIGGAWYRQGKLEKALAAYDKAIELNSKIADAWTDKATVMQELGKLEEAVAFHRHASTLDPKQGRMPFNLGNALFALGRFEEAQEAFRRAVELKTDNAAAWINLGNACHELQKTDAALEAYAQAIQIDPGDSRAFCNRGIALFKAHRQAEALEAFEQALALDPAGDLGTNEAAVSPLSGGVVRDSIRVDAHYNRGVALGNLGRIEHALDAYNRALDLHPNMADARFGRGIILLFQGDLRRGFDEYEWRWKAGRFPNRNRYKETPAWKGEKAKEKTLLLHAEQGFGDTLHFIRYLPMVLERVPHLVVECQGELKSLLAGSFSVPFIGRGENVPPFDLQLPLLSLPHVFGTTLESIPSQVPYLKAGAESTARFSELLVARDSRLHDPARLRVGLVWSGNPKLPKDPVRSMPLAHLSPLFDLPNTTFVNLQLGPVSEQIAATGLPLVDVTSEIKDFADTAGLVANLDLVIAVDTAVAHLAGGLAKPVWLLLAQQGEWRWMDARTDSPWYPTARLFRQRELGDWAGVVAQVREQLRQFTKPALRQI